MEGIFKNVAPAGPNTFELLEKGSHNNVYTYQDGLLQKIVIDYVIFNIYILLKQ